MYKCLNCRKDVEPDPKTKRIRCPYCGYRIIIKTRSVSPRGVRAK